MPNDTRKDMGSDGSGQAPVRAKDMDVEQYGERDTTYDLISLLYHALQGAETYIMYADDAEDNGDREAARFFHACIEEEHRRAERAKELLRTRMFQ
jgi:hypothetical protein